MYALCFSSCICCHEVFAFNPTRVPSLMINGVKEPVCLTCIERINPKRVAKGLEAIVPLPGAYEPCDESELPE